MSPGEVFSREKLLLTDYLMPLATRKTVVKGYWKVSEEFAIGNNNYKKYKRMEDPRQLLTSGNVKQDMK